MREIAVFITQLPIALKIAGGTIFVVKPHIFSF